MPLSRFLPPLLCLLTLVLTPVTASALEIFVLPGVAQEVQNVLRHQPAEVEPSLYPLQRVYPGQPFELLVLAREFARNEAGTVDISYTLQVLAPDGHQVDEPITNLELYRGSLNEAASLLLSRQHLTLVFGPDDVPGDYTLMVTGDDAVAGSQAKGKARITLGALAQVESFVDERAFLDWMSNYYRAPDPGRVFAAIRQFVDLSDKGRISGVPMRLFLARILLDNPFLRSAWQQAYVAADADGRKRLLLVLATGGPALADWAGKVDTPGAAFYGEARRIALPDLTLPPASIPEINTLWGQFYATGDIAPLRSLVAGLALHRYKGVQEKLVLGTLPETADSRAQAAMEDVYKALLWSLVSHGNQHSRVEKYLRFIFEEPGLDPSLRGELEQLLQIIEKQRLEDEANRKLQEKAAGKK